MRAIWKGALTFGLVNVPVKVYSATEDHDVPLHQVHAADGGRIRYQRICELDGEVVPYAEIDKARATLKERKTIERAKGVLMNYRQHSEGDAYKLIRQTAMNQNRRMLDVAEAILATVDLLPRSTNS